MREICGFHKKAGGYVQWHLWAEEQTKKGIKPIRCQECNHYFFPSDFGSVQDRDFKPMDNGQANKNIK